MLDLGLIQVGITLIHNLVEMFTTFPYAHFHLIQFSIFFPHPLHKVDALVNVIDYVELLDPISHLAANIIIPKSVAECIRRRLHKSTIQHQLIFLARFKDFLLRLNHSKVGLLNNDGYPAGLTNNLKDRLGRNVRGSGDCNSMVKVWGEM
ncbi:hypothetical protein FF1_026627 [Malus domestica]